MQTFPSNSDWFEYSAIRDIIKNGEFALDEYIGVLSPRFHYKTGLSGVDLIKFVEKSEPEIINFSHGFSQIALFENVFKQGDYFHPGLMKTCIKLFDQIGLKNNLDNLIMDQTRSVYSNYFVAKHSFWLEYIKYSEKIFEIARGNSDLALELRTKTRYKGKINIEMKVFVMERLISGLLNHLNIDAEVGFSHSKLKYTELHKNKIGQFMVLDSLKTSYLKAGLGVYLNIYRDLRKKLIKDISQNKPN